VRDSASYAFVLRAGCAVDGAARGLCVTGRWQDEFLSVYANAGITRAWLQILIMERDVE
jgi:hypothetical protein